MQAGLNQLLTDAGYEPCTLPLIDIKPIDMDSANQGQTRNYFLNLDLYSSVIFISRNAAQIGGELIDHYWPQLPLAINWFAIGRGTADELENYGIPTQVNQGIDSEALLSIDALQHIAEQRILIIKGTGGRDLLAQTLTARGAKVDLAEIYTRTSPSYSETELAQALDSRLDAILVTSGEALSNLDAMLKTRPEIKQLPLILPSQRVADLANMLGFTDPLVANGADNYAMLDTLNRRLG